MRVIYRVCVLWLSGRGTLRVAPYVQIYNTHLQYILPLHISLIYFTDILTSHIHISFLTFITYTSPYTLYTSPYTLYTSPYTSPYTLYISPYTLYTSPYTLYTSPYTLYTSPYTLYTSPYTLYTSPYTSPYTLYTSPLHVSLNTHRTHPQPHRR
ncbi:hypothetical protein Pcinc_031425 [Petrolisthes cinctipes]|uniref:Uncharacterized protein n=1 Tax=Petrolisthes cinctipes TaxID=88211 RepID=A0AAE1EW63_PETCI|nr:hypothetical protein Pcinc_031425 [Petrolisthes cinctipes]